MAISGKLSARDRLRRHFLANLGRVMGWEELREASGNITEWGRRVRELRNEEGYQILTDKDRRDLKPGEYLLLNPKPQPAFARGISKEVRARVLDRNGNTCQSCGAAAGDPDPYNPQRHIRLTMGHVMDKSKGGTDTYDNLRAQCTNCNEGLQNVALARPTIVHLMSQIRRAAIEDQREALAWLKRKFEHEEQ